MQQLTKALTEPGNEVVLLLAIGVGSMLSLGMLFACLRALRTQRRLFADATSRNADLQAMISAYGQSLIGMQTSLGELETQLKTFSERHLELQSQYAFAATFEEASRLVRDGGSAESLVNNCGLSNAEAELMVRLHQQHERPAVPVAFAEAGSGRISGASTNDASAPAIDASEHETELVGEEIRLKEALKAARG